MSKELHDHSDGGINTFIICVDSSNPRISEEVVTIFNNVQTQCTPLEDGETEPSDAAIRKFWKKVIVVATKWKGFTSQNSRLGYNNTEEGFDQLMASGRFDDVQLDRARNSTSTEERAQVQKFNTMKDYADGIHKVLRGP